MNLALRKIFQETHPGLGPDFKAQAFPHIPHVHFTAYQIQSRVVLQLLATQSLVSETSDVAFMSLCLFLVHSGQLHF